MTNIQSIDAKIKQLEKKKIDLLKSQAEKLLKAAAKTLGDQFSPELTLTILQDSWDQASSKQKEEWQQKAGSFRSKKQAKG